MRKDLRAKFEEWEDYIKLVKMNTVTMPYLAMDISNVEKDYTAFAEYYFPEIKAQPELIDFEQLKHECDHVVLAYEDLVRAYEKFSKAVDFRIEPIERLEELFASVQSPYQYWITDELLNISNPFKNEKSNKIDFDRRRIIGDDLMWQGRVTRATKRRFAKEMRWLWQQRKTETK